MSGGRSWRITTDEGGRLWAVADEGEPWRTNVAASGRRWAMVYDVCVRCAITFFDDA